MIYVWHVLSYLFFLFRCCRRVEAETVAIENAIEAAEKELKSLDGSH